ncbi:hypothetical protein FFWV33_13765 [Flavobacterium faecale]|uniref:SnoaL-like domain-containing protein n=1 Tax=Flavobacterium faecale TaxID=1355330 RepID=A0A2S1LG49_9FLAO|nr:nuclear transport factor 2 family protein [Flavobacterium faecale]AWG22516.1 hypothetical protein FFWV33_13765 [Flavobacterium faecale]
MTAKELVLNFYKSDALINPEEMKQFIHPDFCIEWHSSTGFSELNYDGILSLIETLGKAYVRTKVRISQIIAEDNKVCVRYSHFVKTIENPREEMLLGYFMVIWEIKDDKLFRGFQNSQKP